MYAADLTGAAMGCLGLIAVLAITDAPTAVFIIAALAAIGSYLFANGKNLSKAAAFTACVLLLFSTAHSILVHQQKSLLSPRWIKGRIASRPLYEKWNTFSRIAVSGDPLSKELYNELIITIDDTAATPILKYSGDDNEIKFLKADVVNIAHFLRPHSSALIIGPGGGRDVLSAVAFKQRQITAVEINGDILDAVNNRFGDFSGHLDRLPELKFVNDEARSFVARTPERFNIIQTSFIDTWAATAAGAMVFTENSLYTVEAWQLFLNRLAPDGIVTFSRWYHRELPAEMYRLTAVAAAALKRNGIDDPSGNILVLRRRYGGKDVIDDTGVLLVGKRPFTSEELSVIDQLSPYLHFDVIFSSQKSADSIFTQIAQGKSPDLIPGLTLNITPSVDDKPFFFFMLKVKDFLTLKSFDQGMQTANTKAVSIMIVLLFTVLGLSFFCLMVPLFLTHKGQSLKGSGSFFVFFAAIGLGFMFIEISQMQRLILFLGHPVYGLSIVLFSLLVSSGLGSLFTDRYIADFRRHLFFSAWLIAALAVTGLLTVPVLSVFQSSSNLVRFLISILILLPAGFLMGMQFPFGMKIALSRQGAISPWLWGINGAASVCASVLAMVIALVFGISTTFWMGFVFYLVAFFIVARK
ncbi:MAG: hypothetical protein HQL16_00210 [Candidatus Omnitrophica bacterium]|nr:hypothetical protein [Candidatus Omnitrophota bacterium]